MEPFLTDRLALSTRAYEHLALSDALERITGSGFQVVELVADQPHLFVANWPVGRIGRLADELDTLGLRVGSLCAESGRGFFAPIHPGPCYEPSLITPQSAMRRLRRNYLLRCLEFAHVVGAPTVAIASGPCLPGVTPAHGWELLIDAVGALLGRAEELGVLIAVAPRPGHLISRLSDFATLVEALPHPLLGLSLDTAQLALEGVPPARAIAQAGDRLWRVQLTDASLPHPHRLRPGLGAVDLAQTLGALDAHHFSGPLVLQLEHDPAGPDAAAIASRAHLAALLAGGSPDNRDYHGHYVLN